MPQRCHYRPAARTLFWSGPERCMDRRLPQSLSPSSYPVGERMEWRVGGMEFARVGRSDPQEETEAAPVRRAHTGRVYTDYIKTKNPSAPHKFREARPN
uniref:Uncharacterized protein n=1 Tax=Knipowitschia caucasica TaxID=637954 RepID=A0AAV2JJT4_KNICA